MLNAPEGAPARMPPEFGHRRAVRPLKQLSQFGESNTFRHGRRCGRARLARSVVLTDQQKDSRAIYLSSFFWTIGPSERVHLIRTMRAILDHDDDVADRVLILRAIAEAWPPGQRPAAAQHVADFYRDRPDVADRAGAYGV